MLVITCKGEEAGSKLCFSSVCKLPGALTWIIWAPKWNRWSSTNDASLAPGSFCFQTWTHKIKEGDELIIGIPRNLRQTFGKQANGPITELINITSLMTPSNDCNPAVQTSEDINYQHVWVFPCISNLGLVTCHDWTSVSNHRIIRIKWL